MILSLVLLAALVSPSLAASAIPCGEGNYKKVDETLAKVFVIADDRKFPTSKSELTSFCRDGREYEDAVKDYAKQCTKGTAKTLLSLIIYNAARINKMYCTNRNKKQEFITNGNCGNQNIKEQKACFRAMNEGIMDGNDYSDDKKKLPIVCCNYYKYKKCVLDVMKNVGSSKCSADSIKHYNTYMNRQSVEVIKVLCSGYEEGSKACKELLPTVKKKKHSANWRSPLVPIIDLLSNI